MKHVRNILISIPMIAVVSTVLFLVTSAGHAAVNSSITWIRNYNDTEGNQSEAYSIRQASDGGYIVAGYKYIRTNTNSALPIMWVMKLDPKGEIAWQKSFYRGTDPGDFAYAFSAIETSDGGYVVTGMANTPDTTLNAIDAVVIKLKSNGDIEWQKSYANYQYWMRNNLYDVAYSIYQTADGGFVLGGVTAVMGGQFTYDTMIGKAWLMKLDANGNREWQKIYDDQTIQVNDSFIRSVQQTPDGGYIATGFYRQYSYYFPDANPYGDAWVIKTDNLGNIIWQKNYRGVFHNYFTSIRATRDGGYIASGGYGTSTYYKTTDALIVKLDSIGNILWYKTFGSTANNVDNFAKSVEETNDGSFIISGWIYDENAFWGPYGWIIKLDQNGELAWQKTLSDGFPYSYAFRSYIHSIRQTSDDGYVATGLANMPYRNITVLKLDTNGIVSGCASEGIRDFAALVTDRTLLVQNTTAADQYPLFTPLSSSNIMTPEITYAIPWQLCLETKPRISINPGNIDFGSVNIGASVTRTINVVNAGSGTLNVNAVGIIGQNALDFSAHSGCSGVGQNSSCTINVSFMPLSSGVRNAALTISSNDPETPILEVPLTGIGTDTTPPTITISTSTAILWPPNHKMVDVSINGAASDSGSGLASVAITVSDEYGVYNMIVPGFGSTIQLEASRLENDLNGRQYTITAVATDMAGNQSTATTIVTVPHDIH